jgi:hypothetical protein
LRKTTTKPLRICLLLAPVATCAQPSTSPVRLNEVMPSNGESCADELGEHDDWLELFNTGDVSVALGGYSLTDDTASPRKSVIPEGVSLAAHGTLLLWADHSPSQGETHLALKLSAAGEEVVLYDADTRQVDLYRWTDAYKDLSFARLPDGSGDWQPCSSTTCPTCKPSCGALNSVSCGGTQP